MYDRSKFRPGTDHESPDWEKSHTSTISLTSALDCGGWLTPRLGRFTPGKEILYLLYGRLDGPQGSSGRMQKISPPPEVIYGPSGKPFAVSLINIQLRTDLVKMRFDVRDTK
jgi:hypothetical protein